MKVKPTNSGMIGRQCATADGTSEILGFMQKFLKSGSAGDPAQALQRVMTEHSVLSIAFDRVFAEFTMDQMITGFEAGSRGDEKFEIAKKKMQSVREKISSLGHTEGAFFVDAPRSGFIPSGGLSLSGSSISADKQVEILKSLLAEFSQETSADYQPVLTEEGLNDSFRVFTLAVKPGVMVCIRCPRAVGPFGALQAFQGVVDHLQRFR